MACLRALSYPEFCMRCSDRLILGQDGITNGAIYALLTLVHPAGVYRYPRLFRKAVRPFGATFMASLQARKPVALVWLLLAFTRWRSRL